MFEFIEKVIYINLEHRTDRKQQIESQLEKYFPLDKIKRFNAIKHTNGGIGCTLSHIAILEMAIKEGWSNYLVVEDDAMWNNFEQGYMLLEKLIKKQYDVITLGIAFAKYTSDFKLISGQTTTAYIVQNSYYTKLLSNFKEGLDNFLKTNIYSKFAIDQYWKQLQANNNWYCVIPSMMIQNASFSDIENKYTNYTIYFS